MPVFCLFRAPEHLSNISAWVDDLQILHHGKLVGRGFVSVHGQDQSLI